MKKAYFSNRDGFLRLSFALVFVFGVGLCGGNPVFADGDPVLSAEVYRLVAGLRQDTGLDARGLASMGLSQTQAKTVLDALVSWESSNRGALDGARSQMSQADAQVREQAAKVNMGTAESTGALELERLTAVRATAKSQLASVLAQAKSTALSSVTSEQRGRLEVLEAAAPDPGDASAVQTRKQQLSALSEIYRACVSGVAQAEAEAVGADPQASDIQAGPG